MTQCCNQRSLVETKQGRRCSHEDEPVQRLATQHASVSLGRLLGAEQQDAGEGPDWLEGVRAVGGHWLSGAEVGPLPAVDHAHLNAGHLRV